MTSIRDTGVERLEIAALDREQFYDELWSFTGQELRIRYALSPFSLQQLCQKHRLPLPPMGHWIKVRHGKMAKRPPLPKVSEAPVNTVYVLLNDPAHSKLQHDPVQIGHQAKPTPREGKAQGLDTWGFGCNGTDRSSPVCRPP
jgi:hypothetical protein